MDTIEYSANTHRNAIHPLKLSTTNIRRKTMNLFINEQTWNNYAETIAMEDIYEECKIFLPKEYEQSNYEEGI
tara:strand:+ start:378 stop:596 length:219 start_codon:yes stop_codon:yes gene_type:complete